MKTLSLLSLSIATNAFPIFIPVMRSAVRSRAFATSISAYDHSHGHSSQQTRQRRTGTNFTEKNAAKNNTKRDSLNEGFELRSAVGTAIGEFEFLTGSWYFCPEQLPIEERLGLLKKVMRLVRAGDPLIFRVRNPKSIERLQEIDCRDAEGDWTMGRFPDLATYIKAIFVLRNEKTTVEEKEVAEKKINILMTEYDIMKEDLEVTPRVPAASPRVQDKNRMIE